MKVVASQNSLPKDPLEAFLGIPYQDPKAFDLARSQLKGRHFPREELAAILSSYNKSIGNDKLAQQQIEKMKSDGTFCVVTGQQLGFMGGPAYTILKGIRCLQVARLTGAVPIFWLATEDHDISEVDHTTIVDELANLKRYHISLPKSGRAVEDIVLTEKNCSEIQAFCEAVGISTADIATRGKPYAFAMAKVLVRLFAGTGMVFLEPRLLRPLAIPFFRREIVERKAIYHILKDTTARLEAAGGKPVIAITEGPNLFIKNDQDHRQKLVVDGGQYSEDELLTLLEQHPERFSPNVAARPMLQNLLLPVIACIGGPAEMDYHRQLGDYHKYYGISMPCIMPRISATMISPQIGSLLAKGRLNPWDVLPESADSLSGHELHLLRNWLYPHQKKQERTLNWWGFCHSKENLIETCLKEIPWNAFTHQYIYYE